MGLFKSMKAVKDLAKQAKEVQAAEQARQGYKPGMSGQLQQFGDMMNQAKEQLGELSDRDGNRARILAEGIDGEGVIVGMGTPARGASLYNLDIDLEVHAAGLAPYRVSNMYMVPASARIGPGVTLPIKIDRADPARIVIVWDRAAAAPSRGEVRPVADAGAGGFAAAPAGSSSSSAGDSIELLERLARLRESGVLSDAEFESEKAKILGR